MESIIPVVKSNDFQDQNILRTSRFSKTFLTLKIDSITKYSKKNILFPPDVPFEDEYVECFLNVCNNFKKLNHPCSMNLSYVSIPDNLEKSNPSIYTVFAPNYSLQNIIEYYLISNTQKMIILYGVSQYLNYLHKTAAHGSLKASNVILNSNLYPLVSDPFFYEFYQKIPNSKPFKSIDYIVSLSKESLTNGTVNLKTDIYSFGIMVLQTLTNKINVYSNISQNVNEIEQNILKGVKPTIPDNITGEIRNLIEKCLSDDPEQRPNASYLVKTLHNELMNEEMYDKKLVDSFQQYLDIYNQDQFEKQLVSFLKKNNFAFTKEGLKRLITLYKYLEENNAVSLVGPNGTSRTLASEIVCEFSGRQLIHFCFNSETNLSYFAKRNYPFVTAFEKGHTVLLENFDIANQNCVQFIQKSLTDGFIIVPGENEKIQKHENFRIIIKEKQNKKGTNFKVIDFPSYTKEDLIEITERLDKCYKCNCSQKLIDDFVDFNLKWTEIEKSKGFDSSISVGKIAATLRSISQNGNLFETIMIIYGSKHIDDIRKIDLSKLFKNYDSFKYLNLDQHDYPKDFPKKYQESKYLFTLQSLLFHFKNNRKVILASNAVKDLNEFVQWFTQYYSDGIQHSHLPELPELSNETNPDKKKLIDIISESFIQTKETVKTVQLNELLDPLNQKFYDKIQATENQNESKTMENIHYLCTCNIKEIKPMTHDLINKFEVVYIHKQNREELHSKVQLIQKLANITKLINESYSSQTNKKYLVCIDRSIFTSCNNCLYTDKLIENLTEYGPENCDIYFWDSFIHHPNSVEKDFFIDAQGEKNLELVADICEQSSVREQLIIFTGGRADVKSIEESDRKMQLNDIKFNKVTTYIIEGDLSTSAPYSRNCPSMTFMINQNDTLSFTKEDLDALNEIPNIKTYNDFNKKYANLRNAIQVKTLGTEGDKDLFDTLISISSKIRETCENIQQKNEFDNKMKSLQNMALGALKSIFNLKEIEEVLKKFGNEVAFNKEEAADLFQIAANKNDVNSMINYANMNAKRSGSSIYKSEAINFYKRAIEYENTDAMILYGDMLYNGNGLPVNKEEAALYYKKAADNKNAIAMLKYASMLYLGDGISSNKEEATRYILMAAESGYSLDFFGAPFYCFVDAANKCNAGGNLWCIDCSGSVEGSELYHEELKLLFSKYRKENDDFYLWDDSIHHTSSMGVDVFVSLKAGCGGTSSELIADICEQSSIRDHLIIVTDGCVGTSSIDESDNKMKNNNIKFNHVTTYVIGGGGNLSVGAPYSRRSPNITYKVESVGNEVPQISLSQEDISALDKITDIETYSQFSLQYEHLHSAIKAKTLGTEGDEELQEKIMIIAPKVNSSCANDTEKKDFSDKLQQIQKMSYGALRNAFTTEALDNIAKKPIEEVVPDKEKVAQFYKNFAESGDIESMITYANLKLKAGDKAEAATYLKKAADTGNVVACLSYAFMLKHGDGISADKSEALHYFKLAADNGGPKEKLFYSYMLKKQDK